MVIGERKGASEDSLASQNASSLAKERRRKKRRAYIKRLVIGLKLWKLELGAKGKRREEETLAVANWHSLPSNRKT